MKKTNLHLAAVLLLMTNCSLLITKSFAQYTMLYDFTTYANGVTPFGSLVSDGTYFYGMTSSGGASGYGVIFKIKLDGTGYNRILDFAGANGSNPEGSLIYDGTYLYGMTTSGGANSGGTIFKIKPDGTGYLKLHDFSNADGATPYGSLISDGTYLFGMTNAGGSSYDGTLFKIKTDGTGFLKLLDFSGDNGNGPYGDLFYDGTYLYGATNYGGGASGCYVGCGMLFKVKPDGTGYDTLMTFSGTNGQAPHGTLISDGTYLYGVTSGGGAHLVGTIFKIKPDGTGYSKMYEFTGYPGDGANPFAALVSDGTYLYGMTNSGGNVNKGTIFQIKPDGTGYSKLLDFGNSNGSSPYGSLIMMGSSLYGLTEVGSFGTLFKYQLATGINELDAGMSVRITPNPFVNDLNVSSNRKGDAVLYDITGKEILRQSMTGQETKINTGGIAAGFYFLNYSDGTKSSSCKLVKF